VPKARNALKSGASREVYLPSLVCLRWFRLPHGYEMDTSLMPLSNVRPETKRLSANRRYKVRAATVFKQAFGL